MKRLMSLCLLPLLLAACSGQESGSRTDQMTDAAEQHNPSSNPNPQPMQPQDTSGTVHDSSTVISYDTAARVKHN